MGNGKIINDGADSAEVFSMLENYIVTPESISDEVLDKSKRLLNSFKNILWTLNSNIEELDEECQEVMREELSYAIEVLDKFDYRIDLGKLEGKLQANQEVRLMARLIIVAMLKVKEFPGYGASYYEILQKNYLVRGGGSESDILFYMEISRSTYYKYKKDAVRIFGYCLWKIILPNMKKAGEKNKPIPIIGKIGASSV